MRHSHPAPKIPVWSSWSIRSIPRGFFLDDLALDSLRSLLVPLAPRSASRRLRSRRLRSSSVLDDLLRTDDSELRRGRLSFGGLANMSNSSFGPGGLGRGRMRWSLGSRRTEGSSDRDGLWLPKDNPFCELVLGLVADEPANNLNLRGYHVRSGCLTVCLTIFTKSETMLQARMISRNIHEAFCLLMARSHCDAYNKQSYSRGQASCCWPMLYNNEP